MNNSQEICMICSQHFIIFQESFRIIFKCLFLFSEMVPSLRQRSGRGPMVAGPSNGVGSFIRFVRAEDQVDQDGEDTEPEEEVVVQEDQEPCVRDVNVMTPSVRRRARTPSRGRRARTPSGGRQARLPSARSSIAFNGEASKITFS